jgi:TetR/AcrR family transcriptional regulator, cholesterol catabolism regulator
VHTNTNEKAPPKRLGRPPRNEHQRERILEEAAVLFARSGFDASSLNELAEEIGISKAGIYHYFKTKQDVYDAIIVQTLQGLFDTVSARVADESDPYDRLLAFMMAHADYFEHNYWAFRAMLVSFTSMSASGPRREATDLRERYEQLLRGILAEGVAQGAFRDVDPADAGRMVLSLLNWMARWFHPGGPKTAPEVARDYADLLIRGLHR